MNCREILYVPYKQLRVIVILIFIIDKLCLILKRIIVLKVWTLPREPQRHLWKLHIHVTLCGSCTECWREPNTILLGFSVYWIRVLKLPPMLVWSSTSQVWRM